MRQIPSIEIKFYWHAPVEYIAITREGLIAAGWTPEQADEFLDGLS